MVVASPPKHRRIHSSRPVQPASVSPTQDVAYTRGNTQDKALRGEPAPGVWGVQRDDADAVRDAVAERVGPGRRLRLEEMDGHQREVGSPDIFERVSYFQLADQARAAGLYPFFQPIEVNDGPEAIVDGKRVIMLGSNNYLGLTRHPKVLEAAHEALDRFGPSMTGSRLLNGTSPVHLELEEALADFLGAETAIVFSTGYLANLGAVSALVDRHGVSVLDRDVHASIYDAAGLALGKYTRFQHNDPAHLDRVLSNLSPEQARLVLIDGAYSMGGDLAPLPELRAVCRKHNTRMLVDDAHAIGTVGPTGRGTRSHFGLEEPDDLTIGTFSKTLASVGGFCAGPRMVIEYIRHFSRPMLFTAALPPASAAARWLRCG